MALMLIQGDACHIPLQDQSIHCITTSPPYYGLRAYAGLAPTYWPGGSYVPVPGASPLVIPGPTAEVMAACTHAWVTEEVSGEIGKGNWAQGVNGRGEVQPGGVAAKREPIRALIEHSTCLHCGCWRGCLGNEPDVPSYVFHTLLWLRECRRVLRNDGVLWLNLGDAFASSGGQRRYGSFDQGTGRADSPGPRIQVDDYPAGTLLGIPQQVMLAAMADGWIVRNDCVFAKVAPMPESIRGSRWEYARCRCVTHTRGQEPYRNGAMVHKPNSDHDPDNAKAFAPAKADPTCPTCHGTGRTAELVLRRGSWRHTRAHEFVFQLAKQIPYWSDGESVREEATMKPQRRTNGKSGFAGPKYASFGHVGDKGVRDVPLTDCPAGGRNPRSVLTPTPSPLGLAHYASFPPSLIEPLIRATCPAQCCALCGGGYAPVLTSEGGRHWHQDRMKSNGFPGDGHGAGGNKRGQSHEALNDTQRYTVHGYRPTCRCVTDLPPRPGICLDPFGGSGTVAEVARWLRRDCILVEASATYTALQRQRLSLDQWDAWEGRIRRDGLAHVEADLAAGRYDDLPLFAGGT